MSHFVYRPQGVCSQLIEIETENGIIQDVQFLGGCNGNLQGISALIKGMSVEDAKERLRGIQCGFKDTSCPDQLARALEEMSQN
jgi:uncharacterized protein (TIGR03905 family)